MSDASIPVATKSVVNRTGSASSSLYQLCRVILSKLDRVPGFNERFMEESTGTGILAVGEVSTDPVSRSLHAFRLGASLCYLFNQLGGYQLEVSPEASRQNLSACKRATAHFIMACQQRLNWDTSDLFAIHELYGQDTNGVVRVIHTVSKLMNELEQGGHLSEALTEELPTQQMPVGADERFMVVKEILDSERKYVMDLEVLQDYQKKVAASGLLTQDQIHNLFLNLNKLADFQRRFLIGVEANAILDPSEQRFGFLFTSMEFSFSVYEPYCANFNSAQELAMTEHATLASIPDGLDPVAEVAPLLIKPVQRICKYPLLLSTLIKNTPADHPRYEELQAGLASIERVINRVNETTRKEENKLAVQELIRRVEDWKGHDPNSFGDLLLRENFQVIKADNEREYTVYLFERIILCCKEANAANKKSSSKTSSMLRRPPSRRMGGLQLKGRIFVNNVTAANNVSRTGTNLLEVRWRGDEKEEAFTIRCRTEELLKQWQTAIQRAMDENMKKKHHQQHPSFSSSAGNITPNSIRRPGTSGSIASIPSMSPGNGAIAGTMSSTGSLASPHSRFPDTPLSEMGPGSGSSNTPNGTFSHMMNHGFEEDDIYDGGESGRVTPGGRTTSIRSVNNGHNGHPPHSLRSSSSSRQLRPKPSQEWSHLNGSFNSMNIGSSNSGYEESEGAGYGKGGYASMPAPPPLNPGSVGMMRSRSQSSPNTHKDAYGNNYPQFPPSLQHTQSSQGEYISKSHASLKQGLPPSVQAYSSSSSSTTTLTDSARMDRRLSATSSSSSIESGAVNGDLTAENGSNYSNQANGYGNGQYQTSNGNGSYSYGGYTSNSPHLGNTLTPGNPPGQGTAIRIKVTYNDDTFVVVTLTSIPYQDLVDKILKKIRLCGGPNTGTPMSEEAKRRIDASHLRLRYEDEDGDRILIASQEDVVMAFESVLGSGGAKNQTLVLYASVDLH